MKTPVEKKTVKRTEGGQVEISSQFWLGRGWRGQCLTVERAAAQLRHIRSSAILYSRLKGTEPDDVTLFLVPVISFLIGGASNTCSDQSNWSMPR